MFEIGDIVVSTRKFSGGTVSKFAGIILDRRYGEDYYTKILIHNDEDRIGGTTTVSIDDIFIKKIEFL